MQVEELLKQNKRPTIHTTKSELIGDRCRRATVEFVTAEEDLNDCLGRMGRLIKDTAGATHALSLQRPRS